MNAHYRSSILHQGFAHGEEAVEEFMQPLYPPSPCRTIVITEQMREEDARQRAERERALATHVESRWPLKRELREDNLRTVRRAPVDERLQVAPQRYVVAAAAKPEKVCKQCKAVLRANSKLPLCANCLPDGPRHLELQRGEASASADVRRGAGMTALRFTYEEACRAADGWGLNCGPAAVAAICGMSLDELRPHLGDFEAKRYTNPTLMGEILINANAKVRNMKKLDWRAEMRRAVRMDPWPRYGLARVQWEGPWTKDGVPMAARYRHTHWVGSSYSNRGNVGIWDVNCLNNGTGWVGLNEWTNTLVPWLLKECHPRADGGWHLTHTIEIEA